jgi:hypothetical protein
VSQEIETETLYVAQCREIERLIQIGTRDLDNPCRYWSPGPRRPGADCATDGHHMCPECEHMAPDAWEDR